MIIAHNLKEAQAAVSKCMKEKVFAEAGKEIIIEEFLEGEEVSLFALVDAKGFILPLTTAQDHKKINENLKLNKNSKNYEKAIERYTEIILTLDDNSLIKSDVLYP